jgi:hypothetical protein
MAQAMRSLAPAAVVNSAGKKSTPYHGQGKAGSVPRTQFYLASSGDYRPEALKKIYQTPTSYKDLGHDVGGEYYPQSNSIDLNSRAGPLGSNYILRHEASHMFDRDMARNAGLRGLVNPTPYASEGNEFAKDFDAGGNYMPYPPGRSDVTEKRASVSMEPGRYKNIAQYYPEFTPQAWQKKIAPIWPSDMGLTGYNQIEDLRVRNGNRFMTYAGTSGQMPAYQGQPAQSAARPAGSGWK